MIPSLRHLIGWILGIVRSRQDLILENMALRQQRLALHTQRPRRRLSSVHKLFWIALRRFWSGWTKPLVLVTPRTVVAWRRAAMDFFTVPTLTFGVLYCFFVIAHDRRKILRCHVTRNPTAVWIMQQMREAWPYSAAHKFLLFDRDAKFGNDVISFAKEMGSSPVRTAFRSPWQNGVAERWVGSCRRDLLDHVIVLNERHLKRLMTQYIRYYHKDRTHLGLAKDTPAGRPTTPPPTDGRRIRSLPRLGGLQHRYAVAA